VAALTAIELPTVVVDNHRENRWKAIGNRHAERRAPLSITF